LTDLYNSTEISSLDGWNRVSSNSTNGSSVASLRRQLQAGDSAASMRTSSILERKLIASGYATDPDVVGAPIAYFDRALKQNVLSGGLANARMLTNSLGGLDLPTVADLRFDVLSILVPRIAATDLVTLVATATVSPLVLPGQAIPHNMFLQWHST